VKQALHIFRNDVRRLCPHIAIVLGFVAATVALTLPRFGALMVAPFSVVTLFAWLSLGVRAVHQETLLGANEFWLTRPYRRNSLLAAKVIFLLAFVYLPIVILGCILDASAGVPVLPNAPALFLSDLIRVAWYILPVIAIGSVTRNPVGFAGALIAIGATVAMYFVPLAGYAGPHWNWFGPTSAAKAPDITNLAGLIPMMLITIGAIALQYHLRRTKTTRALLAIAVVLPAITYPSDAVITLSTKLRNRGFHPEQVRIAPDDSTPPRFVSAGCESRALKVDGLPEGATLQSFGVADNFQLSSPYTATVEESAGRFREVHCFDESRYKTVKNASLTLHLGFTVRAVTSIRRIPLQPKRFTVGSTGSCLAFVEGGIYCDMALPLFDSLNAGVEFAGHQYWSADFLSESYSMLSLAPNRRVVFDDAHPPFVDAPPVFTGWPPREIWNQPESQSLLRTERTIGFLQRDLVFHGIRFLDKEGKP
jgi:hypothetical protein